MVKHIVCFKLKENSDAARTEARNVLLSMMGKVPVAQHIEVHTDELHSPRSFDVILEVVVADWSTLDAYQNDDYHCEVVKKYMAAHASQSIALDFEL